MKKDNGKTIYLFKIIVIILALCIGTASLVLLYFMEKGKISENVDMCVNGKTTVVSMPSPSDVPLQVFSKEDVTYLPEILDFSNEVLADEAIQTIYENGHFAGSQYSWMGLEQDGVYYMFAVYEEQEIDYSQYVILSESYIAPCNLCVGMSEEEVMECYPHLAVVDFDNECIYGSNMSLGFNGSGYPHGMDENGEEQSWYAQFDYCMLAEVETDEEMPYYMVLFIKDGIIAGISFEYPTAG